MGENNHSKLEEALGQLLDLPDAERAAALRELEGRDAALADSARRLLAIHARAVKMLIEPPEGGLITPDLDLESDPLVGSKLGEFALVRLLGVGGMGRVYEARQEAPARRVAVKVLSGRFLRVSAARRFVQEGQFLASLAHPGICPVIAAGSAVVGSESIPYLAMEFVDGRPITDAAAGMDPGARLRVFVEVCEAVEHAHRKGVIHRDLKPANILVELDAEGTARPRIVDFGLARMVDAGAITQSIEAGALMGTIDYMSPEQLGGGREAPDTRADVYSLGVVLYELLAGKRPFASGSAAVAAARIVTATDPPRLRHAVPNVHPELDLIVAHAMARTPETRYGSAAELAADVRAHLENRPISVHPPTVLYNLRKYARRHRGLVAGLALAGAVLMLGVAGTLYGLERAVRARNDARAALSVSRFSQYIASIQAAQDAIKLGDLEHARERLDMAPTEHRGWEWSYLTALCVPESKRGPGDGGVRRVPWEMMMGTSARRPYRMDRDRREMQMLDLDTLELTPGIPGIGSVNWWRCSFTLDGRYLVTAGAPSSEPSDSRWPERAVRVFERATGRMIAARLGYEYEDRGFDVDRDATRVVIGGRSGIVRVFTLPDLSPVLEFQAAPEVVDAEFSPDGSLIMVGSDPNHLTVHRAADGSVVSRVFGMETAISWPDFSADGTRIFGLSWLQQAIVEVDVATGRVVRRAAAPAPLNLLTVFPDGSRVAVACADGAVYLYPASQPKGMPWIPVMSVREGADNINAVFVSPDCRRIFVDYSTQPDTIWDAGLLAPAD